MPVCKHCGAVGGYHLDNCSRPRPTRLIRYPSPNVLGLSPRSARS